jgi:dihydroflavonol-4-reductase
MNEAPPQGKEGAMLVVTGATGLVGNNVVRTLLAEGSGPVRALVRATSNLKALDGLDVETMAGDLGDSEFLARAFAGADTVFHLAGVVSIAGGGSGPLHRTNVEGTRNVIAACRQAGVRRLVYCSSIHAFPARTVGAYDKSKAEATLLVRQAAADGLDVVVVHPTGIMGPHDFVPSLLGELVLQCAHGTLPAYVDGGYDFVDVRDVAAGIVAAGAKGRSGEGYILSGNDVSVLRMVKTMEALTGTRAPRVRLPLKLVMAFGFLIPAYYRVTKQRPLFTKYSLNVVASGCTMSSAKAERELGYHARPFAETAADTVAWFRGQGAI